MDEFVVIIPVYRGDRTLVRSMSSLRRQDYAGILHVVIAVNDGTRDSLEAAYRHSAALVAVGHRCSVITTGPSRATAINEAERLLPDVPTLYLDQDAVLSPGAVRSLADLLRPGTGVHFAAPALRIAPNASAVTRAFYRSWGQLPYVRLSPVTFGAYAVSAEGRHRWKVLPRVHSDDKFVRLHFRPDERRVVASETYQVLAPTGVRELVRARRRYIRGNRELERVLDPSEGSDLPRWEGVARSLFARVERWPSSAVFLMVNAVAAAAERQNALWARTPR